MTDTMAQQWSEATATDLREVPVAGLEPPRLPCLDLSLLGAADRQQVVVEWNDTVSGYPREATIPDLFAVQARRSPGAVALTAGAVRLTYGDLDEASRQLARRLARAGVGPEIPVALLAERSADLIVAILAVLRAGGAYVPIDPAWPDERLRTLLDNIGAPLLLVQERLRARASALSSEMRRILVLEEELAAAAAEPAGAEPAGPLAADGLADGLAYVMYTSGSTGAPKGVGVPHRAVVRLVQGSDYIRFGPEEVFLQLAPAAFDASTLEIWGPLLNGGRLVIAPPGAPSYDALAELIAAHGITTLWLTAGLFHQTVDQMIEPGNEAHLRGFAGVRQLLAGGDVLAPGLVRQALCRLPATRLVNGYGPTENTTFTCCHGMSDPAAVGDPVAIGRPIANTYVLVLDEAGAPVPREVAGELYAGGDGLARGYQGRPDLTAERFVPCPLGRGARLYRTGDRVCWRPDGRIEFLGRFDHQVKIRGFRIELGEIESVLRSHPLVQEAVVLAPQKTGGERRLTAYVAADPAAVPAAELRDFLRRSLPEYMVPSAFAVLPALPLNANGKVDRRALAALEPGPPASPPTSATAAARTPVEELVCAVWADVLDRGAVGVHDDFFDLGGHSLLVGRVITRVARALDLDVPASLLFDHPTPAGFAAALADRQGGGARTLPALEPVPREGPLPASYAQERLWLYDQLDPASNAFNIGNALHLRGRLSVAALGASLEEICRRHEVLRTRLVAQGRPLQAIDPPPSRPLALVDLSGLPEPLRAPAARRAVDELQSTPFDLARGPLLRAALLTLRDDERVFCLAIHHIAFDGWSLGLLIGEMMALYGALAACLPSPLP
ncbi:MAG TPA: amino acid adenylation domain-containing protein, partial [Thermoanaerobaculia bacterium]|nr:amino acid adenylation domain-containing protein [Thermoanaerobaculia bacterium]